MSPYAPKHLLVTGGAGFIGSCFIHMALAENPDLRITNLDLLTYAGNPDNLTDLADAPHHQFVRGDIRQSDFLVGLLKSSGVDAIVHFAAESHVDRSISGPATFIETNANGTQQLLQAALDNGHIERFVNVSTDEVYGALTLDSTERFTEDSPLDPRSPYSASKAAADMLGRAYWHTFGLPVVTTRCSNNYGPRQFPEKLIPLMIDRAMHDQPLPVYGDGLHVRDWIYVEDHCRGVWQALTHGEPGRAYNFGADSERPNIEIVRLILAQLGKPESLIEHVTDRLGHDRRYAIDASRARAELGWTPRVAFDEGIARTIAWYDSNTQWLERIRSGAYRRID